MLPRVIVHNATSLDGKTDGFAVNVDLYHELARQWDSDAQMTGCDTMLCREADLPDVPDSALEPPPGPATDTLRPLLVVPDSRGRLRKWRAIRRLPHWRGAVALCSRATPQEYLENLLRWKIPYLIAGADYVDYAGALRLLNLHFGVRTVLVDSGGTLSGILLRAGLVQEVSVLIHPVLVGPAGTCAFFWPPDRREEAHSISLRLTHMERMRDGIVWLRYQVTPGELQDTLHKR